MLIRRKILLLLSAFVTTIVSFGFYSEVSAAPPVADFEYTVEPHDPLVVYFKDKSSGDVGLRNWDFGDGNTSTQENPTHIYDDFDHYTVRLTVYDFDMKNPSTHSELVAVVNVDDDPLSDFSYSADPSNSLKLIFKDNSQNATSWDWDFGDGKKSTDQNPSHTYSSKGEYTVSLIVSNGSETDGKFIEISVDDASSPPPVSTPSPPPTPTPPPGIQVNSNLISVSLDKGGPKSLEEFFGMIMSTLQNIIVFLALLFMVIGGLLYIFAGVNPKMVTAAKACFFGAIIGLALALAAPSFLKEIKFILLGDGTTTVTLDAAPTLVEIVERILAFLLSVIGILATMGLAISGILFLTVAANSAQAEAAKKAMTYSIIGLALAASSLIIIHQIVDLIAG